MPTYKLTYFEAMARGETIRLIFTLAGVDFEDERITMEEWSQLKPSIPSQNSQLPYLTIDGSTFMCQSRTIGRYLAREFGLAGTGNLQQALVDMVVDCAEDGVDAGLSVFRESDESKKKELRSKAEKEKIPVMLKNIEKMLKQNKGGDGFFIGDKVTWADLTVLHLLHFLPASLVGINVSLDGYPKLKAHKARMEALPKLNAYLQKRPTMGI